MSVGVDEVEREKEGGRERRKKLVVIKSVSNRKKGRLESDWPRVVEKRT